MAVQSTIQKKIDHGYKIAAKHLGALHAHYRPISSGPVLVNINMIDELNVAFDQDSQFGFGKPAGYKDTDIYYALCDLTTVEIGDYFYDFADHTFFVGNFEPLKPAMFVRCTHKVSIYRPATNNGYGGPTGDTPIMTGWPVAIELGTKGEKQMSGLPDSVRSPWVIIHLPQYPGVLIEYGDIVIDDLARRYAVSDNHLTFLGWHLTCEYVSP